MPTVFLCLFSCAVCLTNEREREGERVLERVDAMIKLLTDKGAAENTAQMCNSRTHLHNCTVTAKCAAGFYAKPDGRKIWKIL